MIIQSETYLIFNINFLKVIFNLIPDHNADAFNPPLNTSGFANNIIVSTLDGFHKWDSKYFVYIAQNG